jgi:hypothetical protein
MSSIPQTPPLACVICGAECFPRGSYKPKTCGAEPCLKAIYHQRASGRTISDVAKKKIGLANQKKQYMLACSCGCGQMFTRPEYRIKNNKKLFFVDADHKRHYLKLRSQRLQDQGERSYGPGWPKIRAAMRARDKVCQQCGKTPKDNGQALSVHHIVAFRVSHNNDPSNLVSLCQTCHNRITNVETPMIPDDAWPTYEHQCTCTVCGDVFITNDMSYTLCSSTCRYLRQQQWERESRQRTRDEQRPSALKRRIYLTAHARARRASLRSTAVHRSVADPVLLGSL